MIHYSALIALTSLPAKQAEDWRARFGNELVPAHSLLMFRMFAKVPATFTYMDLRAGRQNSVFSQRCADVLRISCRNRCFPDEFRNKPCFTRCLSPVEFLIPL